MELLSIEHLIGNIFFPIIMVVYFVCRFEKILAHNTRAIESLIDFVGRGIKIQKITVKGGSNNGEVNT